MEMEYIDLIYQNHKIIKHKKELIKKNRKNIINNNIIQNNIFINSNNIYNTKKNNFMNINKDNNKQKINLF